jgi:hypothetical protein
MSVIPALERLRQEDSEFKDSLGYQVRHCLKKKKKENLKPNKHMEKKPCEEGGKDWSDTAISQETSKTARSHSWGEERMNS